MRTKHESRLRVLPILRGIVLAGTMFSAFAGEWKITPTLSANETATDNVNLSSSAKQGDLITDISPGISIAGTGGRSKLSFDYQMHNLFYAQNSSRNQMQNSLNAQGTLEAIEDWFFIDASGSIAQQSISAFGGATTSAVNVNAGSNTTETSTYRLSPYVRGTLGNFADYQLRYNFSTSSSKSSAAFDSESNELAGSLKGVTTLANLGWSLDASSQETDSGNGVRNESDRLRGMLTYQIDPQFRVSLIGGRESNDYMSGGAKSYTTKGAGLDWSPTERTKFSLSQEKRFFGDSNSISFSHRTEGSAWNYSESKDATTQPNQQSSVGLTVYDLAYAMCSSLLPTASASDKAACATALIGATPPNNPIAAGFLSSGVTLQHSRQFSLALLGARNSVTFTASQSESDTLSQGAGTGFYIGSGFSNAQSIRQRMASINWSHKLTALSSLTAAFSRMNSVGTGNSDLETTQQMFNVNFTTQLGPKTNAGIGARRVVVDGTTSYTENALTGVFSHQF